MGEQLRAARRGSMGPLPLRVLSPFFKFGRQDGVVENYIATSHIRVLMTFPFSRAYVMRPGARLRHLVSMPAAGEALG